MRREAEALSRLTLVFRGSLSEKNRSISLDAAGSAKKNGRLKVAREAVP